MEITKELVIDFMMHQIKPVYQSDIADTFDCELKELTPFIKELISEGKIIPLEDDNE